jgi:release factor glutamine methyltransferase
MATPALRRPPGTRAEAIREAARRLAGSPTPRLDAELLMAHVLGLGRARLLAVLRDDLEAGAAVRFERLIDRRAAGEPVAYLTGHAGFYGLDLEVGPQVLVPRPETELLVEWAIGRARSRPGGLVAVDVGTGCGAIAIALAAGAPNAVVHATDLSSGALELAARNVARQGLERRVLLHRADLLPDDPRRFDLVVANLPYVGLEDPDLEDNVRRYEPEMALFAASGGLAAILALLDRLEGRLARSADVGLEIGWRQGEAVTAAVRRAFPSSRVRCHRDWAGCDRLVTAEAC